LEILVFANFDFEINQIAIRVLSGETIQMEERFVLNWSDYLAKLNAEGITVDTQSRQFFARYAASRPDREFFQDFKSFQTELRSILDTICETKTIPLETWQLIFREAAKTHPKIVAIPAVTREITESGLRELVFDRCVEAENYRAFLFRELLGVITVKNVFRIRKCPRCGKYFFDNSKNGRRVYCSAEFGGSRKAEEKESSEKHQTLDQTSFDFCR
jgi:hypothetical protein